MGLCYAIRGRRIGYIIADALIAAASYALSFVLIIYPDMGRSAELLGPRYLPALVVINFAVYYLFQIYRVMWAYSNISDIYRLILASVSGFSLFFAYLLAAGLPYSRGMVAMTFLISAVCSVFYRILLRDYHLRGRPGDEEGARSPVPAVDAKRILVVGAGEAGRIILGEYIKKGLGRLIDGFIDDDPAKAGKILNGKMVYGDTGRINRTIRDRRITDIIIAMPSVGSEKVNLIASEIRREHRSVPIRVLPHVLELDERKPLSISLRDIGITDLIGREEITVDCGAIESAFRGKTVLVTGAGGSIGSEICRQLLNFNTKKIVAVGRGEFSMYGLIRNLNADAEFLDEGPAIEYRIADIRDCRLMDSIFRLHRPDIVFHAAAHKHVPLMEFNEAEAMQNNVTGTKNLLDLSRDHGVAEFVFISTDKAVNPSSVMGATKRIAEMITRYYHAKWGIRASIVRFGNVIGSRGSVIPLFMEQIERGGPVTVTHPEVTRYFMSIPEASLLVINAAAYSRGGELFVLDMGRQYRIADIARRLIEFYGHRADQAIEIEYTGLRPGEKLHEDLFYSGSRLEKMDNEKLFILADAAPPDMEAIESFMRNDLPDIAMRTPGEIRAIIKRMIPEFEGDASPGGPAPNSKLVS
ncbi:MAG: polysaccharide biosynthesis protein [Spirochaetes bacterium]|nr:polysaccharide biosynthesis protein [Spirochaetota bacterium]